MTIHPEDLANAPTSPPTSQPDQPSNQLQPTATPASHPRSPTTQKSFSHYW
ncbi:hypothetical protein PtB15_16B402 [Puccinia triticina]|nr:hypothetical protein PtB15_16B402 [Puccinia triticina]